MLFNSFEFLIFFPLVTLVYFLLPHRYRWLHLLVASCYFYMAFVPAYILVLFATIILDYFAGLLLERSTDATKRWLLPATVVTNILVLCLFKYYDFFVGNVYGVLAKMGYEANGLPLLNILLPLGLSFHTFQALSYIFEVSRGNVKAEKHFGIYALYVMFYPQLVAGPIERPQNMLHQFHEVKSWEGSRVVSGLKMMLWGFVKKLVIADRIALYVSEVHYSPAYSGTIHLYLAVFVFFPFQVYADFSGYSSIARGAARVMGFELMENFRRPFGALTTSELWNRWHISLSTWLRDYLFQPLVMYFRDRGKWAVVIGLMVTFFISGLWHGAGWTFIIYGLVQGSIMAIEFLLGLKATRLAKTRAGRIRGTVTTYLLFAFSLIFFRAQGLNSALVILKKMFWKVDLHWVPMPRVAGMTLVLSLISIVLMLYFERFHADRFFEVERQPRYELALGSGLLLALLVFGVFNNASFIYFQF